MKLEQDIGVSSDIYPTILLNNGVGVPDLQDVAMQQGLVPLWSFYSASAEDQEYLSQRYGLTPEEIDELKKVTPPEQWCELEKLKSNYREPEQWFEAAEGLKTVRGLLERFRSNPTSPDAKYFIEALEITQQVLEAADRQGIRFHFAGGG